MVGRERLGGGRLSSLLHPLLGPGAASGCGEGDSRDAAEELEGARLAAPTLSLPGTRARLAEPAGLLRSGRR